MNSILLRTLLVLCFATCMAASVPADITKLPDGKPYTEGQKKWLAEKAKLIEQIKNAKGDELDRAIEIAEKMLAYDRQFFGNVHKEVAVSLDWVAWFHYRRSHAFQAIKPREEILEIYKKLLGEKNWRVNDARVMVEHYKLMFQISPEAYEVFTAADQLRRSAEALTNEGKYAQALSQGALALPKYEKSVTRKHPYVADLLYVMGRAARGLYQTEKAEAYLNEAAEMYRGWYTSESLYYGWTQLELSKIYRLQNAPQRSEKAIREALAICERDANAADLCDALREFGVVHNSLGQFALADDKFRRAVETAEKDPGKESTRYFLALKERAANLVSLQKFDDAETLARQAVAGFQRNQTRDAQYIPDALSQLAGVLLNRPGKEDEALTLIRQAKATPIVQNESGKGVLASLLRIEVTAQLQLKNFSAAEGTGKQLLELRKAIYGVDGGPTLVAVSFLRSIYAQTARQQFAAGKGDDARRAIRSLEEMNRVYYGEKHWQTITDRLEAQSWEKYGGLTEEQRKNSDTADKLAEEAGPLTEAAQRLPLYQKALAIREELYPPHDLVAALWQYHCGYNEQALGRLAPAGNHLQRALETYAEAFGIQNPPPVVASILQLQAYVREEREEYADAIALLQEARRRFKNLPDANSQAAWVTCGVELARCCMELGEVDRAAAILNETLAIVEKRHGRISKPAASVLAGLFAFSSRNNDPEQAKKYLEEATAAFNTGSLNENYVTFYLDKGVHELENRSYEAALQSLQYAESQLRDPRNPIYPMRFAECQRALARVYVGLKKLNEAEAAAVDVAHRQHQRHPDAPQTIQREAEVINIVMDRQFGAALLAKDLDRARASLTREMKYWIDLFGENHTGVLACRERLKVLDKAASLDEEKRKSFTGALADFSRLVYPEGPQTAAETIGLGSRVMTFIGATVGRDNSFYQRARLRRAGIYSFNGNISAASQQTKGLIEDIAPLHGPESAMLGSAYLLMAMVEPTAQEKYLQPAAEILRKTVGERSSQMADVNRLLGMGYLTNNDLGRAESCLRQAHATLWQLQRQRPGEYCNCLAHYGFACSVLGDAARGDALLERAEKLASRPGYGSPALVAMAPRLRSEHFFFHKDFARAEPHAKTALEQIRKAWGENSDEYRFALVLLANVLRERGDATLPGPLYQQAIDGFTARHGAESAPLARVLADQGRMRLAQGELENAAAGLLKAHSMRQKLKMGSFDLLGDLGDVYFQQQKRKDALALYDQVLGFREQAARQWSAAQTEVQQLSTAQKQQEFLARVISLNPSGPDVELVYQRLLALKGVVFARQRHLSALRGQAELDPLFKQWEHAFGKLATLALRVPYAEDRDTWLIQVRDLTNDCDLAEARLAAASGAATTEIPTLEKIKAALPPGAAIVDIIEYQRRVPKEGQKGQWDQDQRLAAFVVRQDRPVEMVDLGPAKPASEEIDAWLLTIFDESGNQAALNEVTRLGRAVRKRLWDPLEAPLQGASLVLVSPDSALTRMPFAALPGRKEGTFLVEDVAVSLLAAPSLLPQLRDVPTRSVDAPLVAFGDVNYGGNASQSDARRILKKNPDGSRSWLPYGFTPLANTGPEVDAVRAQFLQVFPAAPDVVLKQSDCTEARFRRQVPQARWLHLATHGFYAPDLLQLLETGDSKPAPSGPRRSDIRFHPGLLSGMALCGANIPGKPDDDDGILSATEVASLNLSNVELAVLSACETARGQVAGGEGVLGLQRAFQVAGARTVVATLWPISDAATRLLMIRFYRNLWERKMPKLEALREAQLWMITGARASAQAGQKPTAANPDSDRLPPMLLHPSIWAPFIMSGDWN